MPPYMTTREFQRYICPDCGERKDPDQPKCAVCHQRQARAVSPCAQCGIFKPAQYALCADCQVAALMQCAKCGGRKVHPEHSLCAACHMAKKNAKLSICDCHCGCRNYKTKAAAPVCGPCHLAGHDR